MNAGHEVVDIGGRIWFARPDTNGDLPSGERSWEWGVVDGDGSNLMGDWMSEEVAVEAMLDSAADLDREALRVLDETEGWG
jgi:hypothetical protein